LLPTNFFEILIGSQFSSLDKNVRNVVPSVNGNNPALNSSIRRLAYASSSGVHFPRRSAGLFFLPVDVAVELLAEVLLGAGEEFPLLELFLDCVVGGAGGASVVGFCIDFELDLDVEGIVLTLVLALILLFEVGGRGEEGEIFIAILFFVVADDDDEDDNGNDVVGFAGFPCVAAATANI
jgi:hypothetical protein